MPRATITNWDSAGLYLHNKMAEPVQSRKVANNTYLVRLDGNDIAVRYHDTTVLIYHYDGTITLNSGGWHTRPTRDRMNRFLPEQIRVFVDEYNGYDWYVWYRHHGVTVPFSDGMNVNPSRGA